MAYVCHQCGTVYYDEPEIGCSGTKKCARGAAQGLTWYPDLTVTQAERMVAVYGKIPEEYHL